MKGRFTSMNIDDIIKYRLTTMSNIQLLNRYSEQIMKEEWQLATLTQEEIYMRMEVTGNEQVNQH